MLLRLVGYGGSALAAGGGFLLADAIALFGQRGNLGPWTIMNALLGVLLVRGGWRYGGAAFRALRFDRVAVFGGEGRPMRGLDAAQTRLLTKGRPPREVLATPDGRTLLRSDVGGFRHFGLRVRGSRIAADRGDLTRDLTECERRELAGLVRFYASPRVSLLILALVPAVAVASIPAARVSRAPALLLLLVLMLPMTALVQYGRYQWSLFRLSKVLRRDLSEGRITDGRLASGIPWLVDDEPAAWRRARPPVGTPVDAGRLKQVS
jgi:hypothetical protein